MRSAKELFLLVLLMIDDIVRDRGRLYRTVTSQIAQQWAGEQTFSGPILSVPYTFIQLKEEKVKKDKEFLEETVNNAMSRTQGISIAEGPGDKVLAKDKAYIAAGKVVTRMKDIQGVEVNKFLE